MLHVTPLAGGRARTESALHYITPCGKHIAVPRGFETDYASVPSLARFASFVLIIAQIIAMFWLPTFYLIEVVALAVICVAEWLENRDSDTAAVIHDWLFKTRMFGFWKSNYILFMAMNARGAPFNPLWKRWLFLINVCLFGMIPWRQDGRHLISKVTK